jgi:hypothetical protein
MQAQQTIQRAVDEAEVSVDVKSLLRDDVARFVVYCLGVERLNVHSMRSAYIHNFSDSAPLLRKAVEADYTMKIIGFYGNNYFRLFNELSVRPHVLVLGDRFRAPYAPEFKEWLRRNKPAVLRLQKHRIPVTALPNSDYYLGTYSVMATASVVDHNVVSSELDYGALIHLNYCRYITLDDSAVIGTKQENKELASLLAYGMDCDSTFTTALSNHTFSPPVPEDEDGVA